eukprot:g2488.t1
MGIRPIGMGIWHDPVIWSLISQGFCSFKTKIAVGGGHKGKHQDFCRNPYNVTGLCSKQNCPLANSRYATIREEDGVCYLYMKTIERAHTPNRLWEKLKLPQNYRKALEIIDDQLQYWPKFLIHKNKQRLTKIHQYLIRMRKLRLKVRPKLVRVHRKVDKREEKRERKAEKAARLENTIEAELLERLQSGVYGDIYNFNKELYDKTLESSGVDQDEPVIAEEEYDSDVSVEFVEGDFESEGEDDVEELVAARQEEEEEDASRKRKKKRKKKGDKSKKRSRRTYVEVEYEEETTNEGERASEKTEW